MLSGLIARLRSLVHGFRHRSTIESRMSDEFRVHVEMRAGDLVRAGLSPAEATREARREFGNRERYKDEARESRGLHRINDLRVSWLDFKLGFRMLARYPGLTIIAQALRVADHILATELRQRSQLRESPVLQS